MGAVMNGDARNVSSGIPVSDAEPASQPFITIAPIRITGAQIWTAILAIPATITALAGLDIFYKPAKETDLTALTVIVQQLSKAQDESAQAIKRLTEAVDNLSGLVVKIPKPKSLTGGVKLR